MVWCGVLAAALVACGHGAGQGRDRAPVTQKPALAAEQVEGEGEGEPVEEVPEGQERGAGVQEEVLAGAQDEDGTSLESDEEGDVSAPVMTALSSDEGEGLLGGEWVEAPRVDGGDKPVVSWRRSLVLSGDGEADAGAVHKALMGAQGVRSCGVYLADELSQKPVEVKVEFAIQSDGTVLGAWARDGSVAPFIAECIETALSEVRFAPPRAGDVDVEAVLVFEEPVQ